MLHAAILIQLLMKFSNDNDFSDENSACNLRF